jgi:hypothetical protein
MKRAVRAVLVAAVILAVGVFAAVNSKDSAGDSDRTDNTSGHSRTHDDHGKGRVKAEDDKHGDHGPPAWAHRKGPKLDKSQRDEMREEWKALTPEERRTLMDKLIREHMGAMREWRKCLDAGRDDCELPFPPGLAKLR